ncbi:hypothetical protein ES707_14711 [subsurface metagenome]
MADYPGSVKVANEASNSSLKVEGLLAVFPFIPETYFQLLIQVGHFSQPLAQSIKIVVDLTKYLFIGEKGNGSAGATGFANLGYFSLGYTLPVVLLILLAITPDTNPEPGGKGIYY